MDSLEISSALTDKIYQEHLNVSPAVPVICHLVWKLLPFLRWSDRNGKLSELVSEEDTDSEETVLNYQATGKVLCCFRLSKLSLHSHP
ncbi:hypothetical protein LDENG_00108740 [Lucifuga dentata]|nr:hypothetical protein LDENG_00108740 [Lucifuga dentata]